jgi:O-antigen/teichoic acid export membrane protein
MARRHIPICCRMNPEARIGPANPSPADADGQKVDRHLNTDHLVTNLGQRAVSGGFVTAFAQIVKFGLTLGSTVALARLLSPEDFGLVAMTGALMTVLRVFREGGLSTATVQKAHVTQAQVSNLFWINLAFGFVLTLCGACLAPAVAWFFHDERLIAITILLSLSFAVGGSAVQHLALLNRQMRFKAVALIDITSLVVGFVAGVGLAWFHFGYWSLVGMQLATSLTETGMTWLASGWRPDLYRRGSDTSSMLKFGASMTISILLRRLVSGIDVILLGRIYGAGVVGLYSRAAILISRPMDQFINPFDAVFVPLLSRLQDQPGRYRQVFLQAYGVIALLSFPFAGVLMGLSGPIVLFLLGAKWGGVIPIFAWFSIAALHIPLGYAGMWLLTTQGRSQDLLVTGIIFPLLTLLAVAVGLPYGATGVALSSALGGLLIRLPVQFYITGKCGPVSGRDLCGVFFRHLPLGVAVALASWLAGQTVATHSPLVQLITGGLAGGLVALLIVVASPGLRVEIRFIRERLQRSLSRPNAAPV